MDNSLNSIFEEILKNIFSKIHMERQEGVLILESNINHLPPEFVNSLIGKLMENYKNSTDWETIQGTIKALSIVIFKLDSSYYKETLNILQDNLEHQEGRVRSSVADCTENMVKQLGMEKCKDLLQKIIESIQNNSVRNSDEKSESEMHDTEGWKALDTSFKALNSFIHGSALDFESNLTSELLDLIYSAINHVNRFVRESCFLTLSTICSTCSTSKLQTIAQNLTVNLGTGLQDNWSQVRYAASVATKNFLLNSESFREEYYDILLPRMCMNRYYVAEGVRILSLETWKQIMGEKGVILVQRHINSIVDFYIKQSEADNHAVREAACSCIAELATKVDKIAVSPYVSKMLTALLVCFRDESWPVRDTACIACSVFVFAFPEESRETLPELFDLWFDHVSDNISSVRENAAVSVARVLQVYPEETLDKIINHLEKNLTKVKEQKHGKSTVHSHLKNETIFGVAEKREYDNDEELHKNQQLFSCGSLAPKLRAGGCSDHAPTRPKEPWEKSDGCIYLLRELSFIFPEKCLNFIPKLSEISTQRHFPHYSNLQETIWNCTIPIFKNCGIQNCFKYLDLFIRPVFETIQDFDKKLAANSAGFVIGFFRDSYGEEFTVLLVPSMLDILKNSTLIPKKERRRIGRK